MVTDTAELQTFSDWRVDSSFQDFVKSEGVPLYTGSYLENLQGLDLGDWERRGGKCAYTRLGNVEEFTLQIVEIPPGGQLNPEHHMYESVMYVLKGRGATNIWQEGEPKVTIEWAQDSLLPIPLNSWHQEFNASGSEPCRVVFGTNMAHIINEYHNLDFVFNCPYVFSDRFSASARDYFCETREALDS